MIPSLCLYTVLACRRHTPGQQHLTTRYASTRPAQLQYCTVPPKRLHKSKAARTVHLLVVVQLHGVLQHAPNHSQGSCLAWFLPPGTDPRRSVSGDSVGGFAALGCSMRGRGRSLSHPMPPSLFDTIVSGWTRPFAHSNPPGIDPRRSIARPTNSTRHRCSALCVLFGVPSDHHLPRLLRSSRR